MKKLQRLLANLLPKAFFLWYNIAEKILQRVFLWHLKENRFPPTRKWRTEDISSQRRRIGRHCTVKVEAAVRGKPGFAAYQGKLTDAATRWNAEKLNAIMLVSFGWTCTPSCAG